MVVGVMTGMDILQGASLVVGITATTGGMVFGLIRYMLLPYLREQLEKPLAEAKTLAEETNRQVAVNGNKTLEDPTLKDKVSGLDGRMVGIESGMSNLRQAVLSVDDRLEKYLAWASIEHHRIWDAIRFPHLPPRDILDQPPPEPRVVREDGDGDDGDDDGL